jgi:hypothetical protein
MNKGRSSDSLQVAGLPVFYNSGFVLLPFLMKVTAAGTVKDLHLIPF